MKRYSLFLFICLGSSSFLYAMIRKEILEKLPPAKVLRLYKRAKAAGDTDLINHLKVNAPANAQELIAKETGEQC